MKISILKEFILLCDNMNFSKTAEKLFMSESTLSKHISLLEQELGIELFNRSRHHVELTPIGKVFLAEARGIVNRYESALKTIDVELNKMEKTLKIGYLSAQFKEIFIHFIPKFKKVYPNLQLILIDGEYGELLQKLFYDEIDVLLTLDFEKDIAKRCHRYRLEKDYLCAAICKDNPLADKHAVSLEDFQNQKILLPNEEFFKGYTTYIYDNLTEEVWKNNNISYYDRMTSALLMVESEQAVAIVPSKLEIAAGRDVVFVPFDGDLFTCYTTAYWKHTNTNQLINKFVRALDQYLTI